MGGLTMMPGLEQAQDAKARDYGRECGNNSGSWVPIDRMTHEQLRKIISGFEDIDPEVMDMEPAPLSGEYADGLTEQDVLKHVGINDGDPADYEDIVDAFLEAFSEGYWDTLLKRAKIALGEVGS